MNQVPGTRSGGAALAIAAIALASSGCGTTNNAQQQINTVTKQAQQAIEKAKQSATQVQKQIQQAANQAKQNTNQIQKQIGK